MEEFGIPDFGNHPDRHDITEILLKVVLNTINQTIQRRIIKRLS
jgi:hypothetical protein